MTGSRHAIALVIGLLALLLGGAAQAQDDLSAGKSPEQLFQLDCAICHKSPQGLSKAGGLFGLDNFLAQHYTASGATASAIAGYLKAVDNAARAAAPHRRTRHPRRDAATPHKPAAAKKTDKKTGEPDKMKTGKAKTEEPKADEPKADAAKTDAAKTDAAKTDAAKTADEKSDKPKTDAPKMTEPKPDKKKPAPHSEAKRVKPATAEKKTD